MKKFREKKIDNECRQAFYDTNLKSAPAKKTCDELVTFFSSTFGGGSL
jgi:hypothetical protein